MRQTSRTLQIFNLWMLLGLVTGIAGLHDNFWALLIWLGLFWLAALPFRFMAGVNRARTSRRCPACNQWVKNGLTVCPDCEHDFRR